MKSWCIVFLTVFFSLFSFAKDLEPTAMETEMLELINRLRANPQAEAKLMISSGIAPGHVNLQMFKKEMDGESPAPPLVFNTKLIDAARKHTKYQLANGQTHVQDPKKSHFTGKSFMDRYREAKYSGRGGGENVFIYCKSPWHGQVAFVVDWKLESSDGGMQAGRGHRKNLLNKSFTEVGVGMAGPGNAAVTQNFGRGQRSIGGVAYKDKNKNGRYDAGEGLGGVEISFGGKTIKTWKSGAYVLPAGSKSGKISAKWGSKHLSSLVPAGNSNFKFDFIEGKAQGAKMTYVSIYKMDAEAKKEGFSKFFNSRLSEITKDATEMRDMIAFARKTATTNNQDKEAAKNLYNKLYETAKKDVDYLEKLVVLKPSAAFQRLIDIQKMFPQDKVLRNDVTNILRANSSKELGILLKIDQDVEKLKSDSSMREFVKKSMTKRVLSNYRQFIAKASSTELRKEAELKLEAFESSLQQ